MILHLADKDFLNLMKNPKLHLPKRWDGKDFETTLASLFDVYIRELIYYHKTNDDDNHYSINEYFSEILLICDNLKRCVHEYHNGFPNRAFSIMCHIMEKLIRTPLEIYQKTGALDPFEKDELYLFRTRSVSNGATYQRTSIFHVPVSMRSMISTCRYSIAGYPSLYLSTSIDLALEETNASREKSIVSRFKLERSQPEIDIQVLELGIKPQDFNPQGISYEHSLRQRAMGKHISDLNTSQVMSAYLKWYPLIAACSFVRAAKSAPFASEYIIPQLLMQWVRTRCKRNNLMGLRYFSCASIKASEMGFDYVFPVSNWDYQGMYCSVLRDSFLLTEPVYLRDYFDIYQCENDLKYNLKLEKI